MNASHKRYLAFILFFSAFTIAPIFSNYSHATVALNFEHQSNNRSFKENRSHHDFSHESAYNNACCDKVSLSRHQFSKYTTAHDFQHHFTVQGSTENQILSQRCLYMFDEFVKFAQTYNSYKCTIQQLHAELKNITWLQKAYYMAKGTYCAGLQKRIHFLYNELNTIKTPPQNSNPVLSYRAIEPKNYTQPAINECSHPTLHTQLPEYKTLDSTHRTYTPSFSKAIEKRVDAYNSMSNNNAAHYATKTYNLNNNVKHLLHKHGHNIASFNECFGTHLDHAIHHESLDILERIDSLSPHSVLYDHQEALVDLAVVIVDYNHEGLTDKATQVADLCWTLLDYGQAVAEGAVLGVYSAAHDLLTNPIEATVNIVAGKQVLAYQLSKVLYNVAEIGVTAISNFDHAKDKWNKYTQPLNNIIDAIYNKEITLRDAIKSGTAFVVGYKTQGKLLGGLGKFCNTIKQKSLNFIQKNPLLSPQKYLATPEGLLFKATSQTDKLNQSGQATSSNILSRIEKKVAKHKSIKGLIKKEGLPTKGKLRYVPPKKIHASEKLPEKRLSDGRTGFIDRFGNVWVQGASRTKGQPHEWDVQLSRQGIQQVGWMTRDNSHLNVSLDGRVTHK